MDQGRYDDALPQLTTLAEQDPKDPGTQISLATALSQTGKPTEAAQAFATTRQLSEAYQQSSHRDQE